MVSSPHGMIRAKIGDLPGASVNVHPVVEINSKRCKEGYGEAMVALHEVQL